jgi:hypothetical protein
MATKTTKGDHGTADQGSHGRGPQKATYSSSRPEASPADEGADTAREQPAGDEDRNP